MRESKLNPWLHIWTQPRAVMSQALNEDKTSHVWLLFILGALVWGLDTASSEYYWDFVNESLVSFAVLLLISVSLSVLLNYYIFSRLLEWAGNIIGGEGETEELRIALAYSFIPSAYSLIIVWLPLLLLFGMENFSENTSIIDNSFSVYSFLLVIDFIIAIWALIITLKVIGEAHHFSAWKALGALLIAALVIFIPILIIVLIIF